jgi:hypothetical protein
MEMQKAKTMRRRRRMVMKKVSIKRSSKES